MRLSNPSRLFRLAAGISLAVLIAFCAVTVGSPWEQRKRAQDQKIRQDIATIASKLQDYSDNHSDLPASLEDLDCAPYERPYDERNQMLKGCASRAISYERLSADKVRLCATFLLPGPEEGEVTAPRYRFLSPLENKALKPLIGHPAGRFCFELKAEPKKEETR